MVPWSVSSANTRSSTVNIRNSRVRKAVMKTANVLQEKEENSSHAGKKADSEGKEDFDTTLPEIQAKQVKETENRENSKGIVSQESRNLRKTKLFPDRSL